MEGLFAFIFCQGYGRPEQWTVGSTKVNCPKRPVPFLGKK
jgi:hypothetical protein